MNTPAINKSQKKSSLINLQATFNRQCRKIDQLRGQLETLKNECEQALILYHSTLKPKEKKAADLITQFILKVKDLTQKPKTLNKKEQKTFQLVLKECVDLVFNFLPPSEIHEEIMNIYKDIYGRNYNEKFCDEMSTFAEKLKKETGVSDIDLSNLNANDNLQDLLMKLMESLKDGMNKNEAFSSPKPKSKKEMLAEEKLRSLEVMQSKGLNNIYKRLAKELHPDLEQDAEKRIEKETLMKRLTVAYSNQDLVSLLALESEWLGGVDKASDTLSEESLKAYNSLLKNQIEELKEALTMSSFHSRYFEIHRYIQDFPEMPIKGINQAVLKCDPFIEQYTLRLNDLSGENPLKLFKKALAELEKQYEHDSFLDAITCFFDETVEFDFFDSSKTHKKKKSG